VPGLLVLRIGAPLYAANVRVVQREVLAWVDGADGGEAAPRAVVLDASAVGRLSTTVLTVMRETDQQLADRGVTQWVASLPPRALAMARHTAGWVEWTRDGRLHPTAEAAVRAFQRSGGTKAPRL
jgi:SulP family sulfate permease